MSVSALTNVTMIAERHFALGTTDYIMILIMLLISCGIGVFFKFSGGKQSTTEEFLMAGRDMAILPVALSVMASGKSAIAYLGTASEMYTYGTYFAFTTLGTSAGALAAGYLFLPVFFKTKSCTAYEYLERRYGKILRIFCSLTFVVQSMLYLGVILYAPALAMSAVTNLSVWTCVIAMGVVCIFYCTLGGMKAVLWTDVFQSVLMYGGLLAMAIKGSADVGGVDVVIARSKEGGRLLVPGFEMDLTTRYTFINVFLNAFFLALSAYGANQMFVQRLLTVRSVQRARCALFANIPMAFLFHAINCFVGLVIYANFYRCDPLISGENIISKPDQLVPYFSLTSLGHIPGLPGLCICGMLSAALSTLSSILNSLTTVTMEDFIRPASVNRSITDKYSIFLAKSITFVYGFIGLLLTYIVANFGNVLQASYVVYGLVAGPTLGIYLLGVLTSRTNEKGATIGLLLSFAVTAWISIGGALTNVDHPKLPTSTDGCPDTNSTFMEMLHFNETESTPFTYPSNITDFITQSTPGEKANKSIFPLYRISYMWYTPIGVSVAVVFGYLSSFLFCKTSKPDSSLLSPVVTKFKIGKTPEKCNNVKLISAVQQKETSIT